MIGLKGIFPVKGQGSGDNCVVTLFPKPDMLILGVEPTNSRGGALLAPHLRLPGSSGFLEFPFLVTGSTQPGLYARHKCIIGIRHMGGIVLGRKLTNFVQERGSM